MHKADLYRHLARQATETAEEATSKKEKADLLEIADAWLRLANSKAAGDERGFTSRFPSTYTEEPRD